MLTCWMRGHVSHKEDGLGALWLSPPPQLSPGHCHEGNHGLQLPEAAALAGGSFVSSRCLLSQALVFGQGRPPPFPAAHCSAALPSSPVLHRRGSGIHWLWDEGFSSQVPLHPIFSTPLSPSCHGSRLRGTVRLQRRGEMLPPCSLLYLSLDPLGTQNPPLPSETIPRVTS